MNQYLAQNFNQLIDLFENIDTKNNVAVSITSESDFHYTFMSREQMDNVATSDLSLHTGSQISKVINANQRYLLIKSDSPTVVNVQRRIITSQIAEFFGNDTLASPAYFFTVMLVAAVCIFILFGAIILFLDRGTKKLQSPLNAFRTAPKGQSIKAVYDAIGQNARLAREQISNFYTSTTLPKKQ